MSQPKKYRITYVVQYTSWGAIQEDINKLHDPPYTELKSVSIETIEQTEGV